MLETARRRHEEARADIEREIDIACPNVAVDVRGVLGGHHDSPLRTDLCRTTG